tara:strand:- start:773 stop:1519 length:747 start_codon:yes stop_codon:yes gene_type:complete
MHPEVSVIIPFYDNLVFLKRAINSVIYQNFRNYEIILIYDNPRNKKNLIFLKEIKNKYSRVRLLLNKTNLGAGYSRNRGIKIARGKFIAFLDSDDVWKRNKLFFQINFMKKNNFLVTHTSYDIVNLKNSFVKKRLAFDLGYPDLKNSCDIGLSTVIISKSLLIKTSLFPRLKTKEDYVLWLSITKKGLIFKGLKKSFTKWTRRPDSLSSSTFQKLKDAFNVYYKYENYGLIKTIKCVLVLSINFLIKR